MTKKEELGGAQSFLAEWLDRQGCQPGLGTAGMRLAGKPVDA